MNVWRPPPRSLGEIRDDPYRFPRDVIRGAKTGLCMFAAEWHGRQDAYWLAEAGVRTTCVDMNGVKLEEMRRVYPDGWEFVESDVFEFKSDQRFDVITLDPYTGEAMERCHQLMPRWCGMANLAVIMGSTAEQVVSVAPRDWDVTGRLVRSDFGGGVYWTVLQPA